jgi:hypothetical protein
VAYWIIAGDIHEDAANLPRIPGVGQAQGLLLVGDMTNRGGPAKVDAVLAVARAANPHVLAQVGNMDQPGVTAHLAEQGLNLHRRAVVLAPRGKHPGLVAMGVGYSNPTPFGTPAEASEQELAQWLAETHAAAQVLLAVQGPGARLVALIHTPPLGTNLDKISGGPHVGSQAVRDFLLAAQPDICVVGHIHEARGEDSLGRTRMFNPGLLAEGGYVRLDFVDGDVSAQLALVPGGA